jgi:hypothetical protein
MMIQRQVTVTPFHARTASLEQRRTRSRSCSWSAGFSEFHTQDFCKVQELFGQKYVTTTQINMINGGLPAAEVPHIATRFNKNKQKRGIFPTFDLTQKP